MRYRWIRLRPLTAIGLLLVATTLAWAQAFTNRTEIWDFVNGLRTSAIAPTSTGGSGLDATMTIGDTTTTSITSTVTGSVVTQSAVGTRLTLPAVQNIAAGGTIAADACGGVKRIDATGAQTTSTTDTFTAPSAANAGCAMVVCNVDGTDAITLDVNTNFKALGAANIVLTAFDCTQVFSDGTFWYSIGGLVAN